MTLFVYKNINFICLDISYDRVLVIIPTTNNDNSDLQLNAYQAGMASLKAHFAFHQLQEHVKD